MFYITTKKSDNYEIVPSHEARWLIVRRLRKNVKHSLWADGRAGFANNQATDSILTLPNANAFYAKQISIQIVFSLRPELHYCSMHQLNLHMDVELTCFASGSMRRFQILAQRLSNWTIIGSVGFYGAHSALKSRHLLNLRLATCSSDDLASQACSTIIIARSRVDYRFLISF